MVHLRENKGFLAKAATRGLIGQRARCQHLERDIALEALVTRTDTSEHDWLEGRGPVRYLVRMIDDATS